MNYKYGNTPFDHLKSMAENGILPERLVTCTFPLCAACLYGKAIKCPSKTKTAISINESKPVSSVGDCISVNILVFRTPGLIENIYGFISCQFYQYACMCVDHHSYFAYVHILNYQTGYEAVEAK